jgi:hypothetical protein
MSLASLAAEIHEQQKWAQFQDTFGHLRPKRGVDHAGVMVVSHSDYHDQGVSIVHAQFGELESSPWLYEAMNEFGYRSLAKSKNRHVVKKFTDEHGNEREYGDLDQSSRRATGIWEFRGVCRAYANGKLHFFGKWTKMWLYPGRIPSTKSRRHASSMP